MLVDYVECDYTYDLYVNSSRCWDNIAISKFLSYLMRNGYKKKYNKYIFFCIRYFYFYFNNLLESENFVNIYENYAELRNYCLANLSFYNMNVLFNFYIKTIMPIFDIKTSAINSGKTARTTYKPEFVYIFKRKRYVTSIKWIHSYLESRQVLNFSQRITKLMFWNILNYKNSIFVKRKFYIYHQLISKKTLEG